MSFLHLECYLFLEFLVGESEETGSSAASKRCEGCKVEWFGSNATPSAARKDDSQKGERKRYNLPSSTREPR